MLCLLLLALALAATPSAHGAARLPPIPADKSTPIHQRLSLTAPDVVSVGWNTYEKLSKPCVHYGTAQDALNQTACSTSSVTYPTSRTWANSVRIEKLAAATRYYYKIDSTNSTTDYFQSGRKPGDTTAFTMNVLADMGVVGPDGYTLNGDASKRDTIPTVDPSLEHTTISQLAKSVAEYEFIVHPGDLAYADDWAEVAHNKGDGVNAYEAITEQFFEQLAPVSGRKPYLVSPGNHEARCQESASSNCPVGQVNFTDFQNRFGAISPAVFASTSANATAAQLREKARSLAVPPFWFSFDYGMVHVVMINTETDFDAAPDGPGTTLNSGNFGAAGQQLAFLKADLASVDRRVTPWVVVAGHRPWYTTGGAGCTACQAAFEKTLYTYGVDVAAFGHVHNLQRYLPAYNNTADKAGMQNPKAPMYVVIGAAGNIEGHSAVTKYRSFQAFAYNKSFGYGALTFHNRTHLGVNFINAEDGSVLDSSTLYKKHADNFVVQ